MLLVPPVLTSVSQNSDLHRERQMVLHSVTHLSVTEGHLQQQRDKKTIHKSRSSQEKLSQGKWSSALKQ